MEELIKSTTAYKIFLSDKRAGKISHAYLLHFGDPYNMRAALKIFAAEFFGGDKNVARRINAGSYPDFVLYPQEGKKITADGISEIIEDSAMRPSEGSSKLYAVAGFDGASALVQNKLLKILEEPPGGVCFILGAASLSPVLGTVLSRVKVLTVPPFTEREISGALERKGENPLNAQAARSCGGILGIAEAMTEGGWFGEVRGAAQKICSVTSIAQISPLAEVYGDSPYKEELLREMQNEYFAALGGERESALSRHALLYALGEIPKAVADLKFNAFFKGLLYDFMLRVVKENDRWLKLQE